MAATRATVELPIEPAKPVERDSIEEETARASLGPGTALLDDLQELSGLVGRSGRRSLDDDDDTGRRAQQTASSGGKGQRAGLLEAILFLRLAEECGLEQFGALRELIEGRDVGVKLLAHLRDAAERHGLGELRPDAGGSVTPADNNGPDGVLSRAPDRPLRDLLHRLYADPAELAALPPDALGHLYERSLGKGEPGGARKTHGAFYTPTYLVEYVVERTLGRALAETGHDEQPPVRVLDPACGSGAFLLGAFRRLLQWHRERCGERKEPLGPELRRAILENAIFGVDVDPAAVAVAKLSLLLLWARDPRNPNDPSSREPDEARMLPRLDRNLRVGHSLIDTDWRSVAKAPARRSRLRATRAPNMDKGPRPFCWEREFPEIFAQGGFDVVIGNPPYLSFGGRHAIDISGELRRYYAEHYESGGWPTAHSLFLERSVKLLSRRWVAFVVPDQLGHLGGYRSAREIAQREAGVVEVRYWGERVFRGVTTPALTIVLDKHRKDVSTEVVDRDGASRRAVFRGGEPWSVASSAALIEDLRRHCFSLGKLVGDCGIRTTSAKEQVVEWPAAVGKSAASATVVPVLEGKVVDRYGCRPPRAAVRLDSPHPLFISDPERYRAARFVIRQTAAYPIVGPREHALHFRNSLLALFSPERDVDVHYLVALLNSKLMRFVYAETVREAHQRTFPQVKVKALQSLPLKALDLARSQDRRRHDALVELAMEAIATQKAAHAENETDRARALCQFELIDARIDELVFDLYELSQDQRRAVERSLVRSDR